MIWKNWKEYYDHIGIDHTRICKDGIINEKEWGECKKKVLFILKEVNDGKGGDLRVFLADGPKYPMWHAVARWSHGIHSGFLDFDSSDTFEAMKQSIRRISTINLKKTSGGASSDMSVINAYTKTDKKLLLEQIETIKPKIIIAGGTFDSLIWLLDLKINPDNPCESPVYDLIREAWVIPWRHPARTNNRQSYNELRELLEKCI